jgi:hypothetical protein
MSSVSAQSRLPKGVISRDSLASVAIAVAIFVPGHVFSWALEWAWLGFQLILTGIILLMKGNRFGSAAGVSIEVWVVVFLVASFSGCVSAFYGYIGFSIVQTYSDFTDLFRFLLFIPLILFISLAIQPRHAKYLVALFKVCVIFNLASAAVLLLGIEPLFSIVEAIYRDAKIDFQLNHIRIGIPFVNPNFAALIFVLILSIFMFFERSIFFASLTIIAIILTGSRSGYIAAVPLLLLSYLLLAVSALRDLRNGLIFILLNLAFLFSIGFLFESMQNFSRIIEMLEALRGGDLARVNTASIRFKVVEDALGYIYQSPVLGVGPGRSLGLDVIDNQLIAWPLNYGIPVALMLYGLFLSPFFFLFRRARNPIHKVAAIFTGLSFFLMLGTGDFMKNYRLFFLVIVIIQCIRMLAVPLGRKGVEK